MLAPALEHLVKGIVDHPQEVHVVAKNSPRGDVLEVRVHPKVFGAHCGLIKPIMTRAIPLSYQPTAWPLGHDTEETLSASPKRKTL